MNAVCQGLRPHVSGCSTKMKTLMAACWDANPSSHPCLSFSFPTFSIFSLFHSFPLLTLFPTHTQQHLMSLFTPSILSSDSLFQHVLFHFNNPMVCGCDMHTICKRRGEGVLWNGQKAGGLSLRVKRDERVGLLVGWGGCECDDLVSNTLSSSVSVTSTHPSMVSHSSVCFKGIVFVVTSISVLVLLCCLTFAPFVQSSSQLQLALGMMSLQSSHLTHAWSSTTLCVMSHHASFF